MAATRLSCVLDATRVGFARVKPVQQSTQFRLAKELQERVHEGGADGDRLARLDGEAPLAADRRRCGVPSHPARLFLFSSLRSLEPPGGDELENARELPFVEPRAVLLAHVDDDAAHAPEVLSVHQGGALRARDVDGPRVRTAWKSHPGVRHVLDGVTVDHLTKKGMLDELPGAHAAVEEVPLALAVPLHRVLAEWAREMPNLSHRLQPELPSAAGAEASVGDVHVEAGGAPHRRDGGGTVAAATRLFVDMPAA
jgi:hypothetical protein